MASQLREGIVAAEPEPVLSGKVECDEVCVVAGHKGHPEAAKKRAAKDAAAPEGRSRARHAGEGEAPGSGDARRGGEVAIRMLENVQQKTVKPLILAAVGPGTTVYTDECDIYARLPKWGYGHKTVCHSRGEHARDEDADGFHGVHANTVEGFWSLLRSWLRPHRGISEERLPLYLGSFQFMHNAKIRGKGLLKPLWMPFWASSLKRIMSFIILSAGLVRSTPSKARHPHTLLRQLFNSGSF